MSDQSCRILLVEDSETQALRLAGLLREQGWSVDWVPTAEEALARIATGMPDLLLVDFVLPGMNGDELCRQLRMRIDTRVLPIIMLTGERLEEAETRGLDSGADDFFRKSGDIESLFLRIRTMVRRAVPYASILNPTSTYTRTGRVLAVDDSLTYLAFLREHLRREAYRLETTTDPEEAIRLVREHDYDCVLIDLVMPEIDGIALCSRVDHLRRTHGLRTMALMLTHREEQQDLARAFEAGADDFVSKASDIVVIKVRIRALLRRLFYEEENRRILEELKSKELEAARARIEQEASAARAALADELERTAAELRRSNEDLQYVAHVTAHDLQTAVRAVSFHCRQLRAHLDPDPADRIAEFVDGTVRSALWMKRLTDDLLLYTEISLSRPVLRPVDLNELLATVVAEMRGRLEAVGAAVTWVELPTVMGDRGGLFRVFQNLLDNAAEYRGAAAPEIRVAARRDDAVRWEVSVTDNGMGFEAKHKHRIFRMFTRLHGRAEHPGTGAGLGICRKTIELHGGRIWAESEPGRGSTFFLTLAADQDVVAPAPAFEGCAPSGAP